MGFLPCCSEREEGAAVANDFDLSSAYLVGHEVGELGEGQRSPVGLGLKQALEHNLVEVAVHAPVQELVELQKRGGSGERGV